jgi:tetratricopeptide (TPR) repeat protein
MARKSEEFHLDVVTETLAQILIKQGHKQKAIEVYEKLMLQNPNNSAFFAAQIEQLRTE